VGKRRSEVLDDLEDLRRTQLALTERLRRILVAMAMSEEVSADLHQRLDALELRPNGHGHAAALATQAALTYREFLARLGEHDDGDLETRARRG